MSKIDFQGFLHSFSSTFQPMSQIVLQGKRFEQDRSSVNPLMAEINYKSQAYATEYLRNAGMPV